MRGALLRSSARRVNIDRMTILASCVANPADGIFVVLIVGIVLWRIARARRSDHG